MVLTIACSSTNPVHRPSPRWRQASTDPSLLEFEISAESSNNARAALRLSIQNVSTERLKVRRHLRLFREDATPPTVQLDVTRLSDGLKLESTCLVRRCGFPPPEFIELAPGDQFSQRVELECEYALPDRGPWRIVAHYHDKSDGPTVDRYSKFWTWFVGHLESNAVEITVSPREEVADTSSDEHQHHEDADRRERQ
jgi:hypothetical protein